MEQKHGGSQQVCLQHRRPPGRGSQRREVIQEVLHSSKMALEPLSNIRDGDHISKIRGSRMRVNAHRFVADPESAEGGAIARAALGT